MGCIMFQKFVLFLGGFFKESNDNPSSKRLAMISTVFAGIILIFCSFGTGREIPTTALTLITTLIGATTATYSITRWKEDGKGSDKKEEV